MNNREAMNMEQNTSNTFLTTYKEVKIGRTTYRVTSVFLGEKDLAKSLEQLAIRKAMTDIRAGTARPVA
jgi:hypothetical protein